MADLCKIARHQGVYRVVCIGFLRLFIGDSENFSRQLFRGLGLRATQGFTGSFVGGLHKAFFARGLYRTLWGSHRVLWGLYRGFMGFYNSFPLRIPGKGSSTSSNTSGTGLSVQVLKV